MLSRSHCPARKRWGNCRRMPAPSPVFFSQPQAPRCSRLSRICTAPATTSWDLRPLRSTRKPTPQASCSYRGSYRPWLGGKPVWLMSRFPAGSAGGTVALGVGGVAGRRRVVGLPEQVEEALGAGEEAVVAAVDDAQGADQAPAGQG